MSVLSYLSLIAFFIYFTLGVYVLYSKPRSGINQSFFYVSMALAVYALAYTFYYIAPTKETAIFWFKISSIGWIVFPAAVVLFLFAVSKTKAYFPIFIFQPLIFLPALILLIQSLLYGLYASDFIWTGKYQVMLPDFSFFWLWVFLLYVSGYGLWSIVVIIKWRRRSLRHKDRIKANLFLAILLVTYLLSITSYFVFPLLGVRLIPDVAHVFCVILVAGFAFGIFRYQRLSIKPDFALPIIVSALQEFLLISNEEGIVVKSNKYSALTLKYSQTEIIGKKIDDLMETKEFIEDCSENQKLTFAIENVETSLIASDAEKIPVVLTYCSVKDEFNDFMGQIFVGYDRRPEIKLRSEMRERRELQHELMKARERAKESDQLKSTFLSNISHELRTPLNGILGFIDILKAEFENSEFGEIADNIDRSGNRLLGTLNSIIDLSLIETNRNEIDKEEVNITELIQNKVQLYQDYAESKNIELKFHYSDTQIVSRTDPRLMGHVISNLLDNAIKYTNKGLVKVSLEQQWIGNRQHALIKVSDTGIGIADADFSKIFERFRQSSEGQNRAYEGMGIGLSICKHFIELLDGEIWLESELGKGSIFYIKIPSYPIELAYQENDDSTIFQAKESNSESRPKPGRPFVLIVENDQSNREYMKYVLLEHCEVDVTISGTRALEMLKKNNYDLIFMDVNLDKDMTGVETMFKIRKLQKFSHVPIVAVSANVMKDKKEFFSERGFSHFLPKPFSRDTLLHLLAEIRGV